MAMKSKAQTLVFALVVLSFGGRAAFAQGTAFTYEGRLTLSGVPAEGDYDFRIAVYDALSGGTVSGGPITNSPVAASNGLFMVTLDFGAGVFTGDARWLDIGVRTIGSASD